MEKMYREGFKAQLIEKNRSHASGLHAILEQVVGDNGNSGMVKDKINLQKALFRIMHVPGCIIQC